MDNEKINKLAYLNTLNKKPLNILLEIIEIECYENGFTYEDKSNINHSEIIKIIKDKYNITIDEHLLRKCINSKFEIKSKKLVLKDNVVTLENKIQDNKNKEKLFLDKVSSLRDRFKDYALKNYQLPLNNETTKNIFNNYIYYAASGLPIQEKNKEYFIFKEFIKQLYLSNNKNDKADFELIEDFGIANQIKDLVLYNDDDSLFLKGCHIFIDTPILIRTLGYDGKDLKDVYAVFLEKLKQAGATLYCFEHSFDELWGILFNYKRCLAQNIMNSSGLNTYLKALKELPLTTLPLEKDKVRINIENMGIIFEEAFDDFDLEHNTNFSQFAFNEDLFNDIITHAYKDKENSKSRIEKDIKSLSAISRRRIKENIVTPESYQDGKYYLLSDNHGILTSLKEYNKIQKNYTKKNELMYEITILFSLWQNLNSNKELNYALFRSKCFSLNVIDETFKDKLYREARRLEIISEDRIQEKFIENPNLEDIVYSESLTKTNDNFDISNLLQAAIRNTEQENLSLKKELEDTKQALKQLEKINTSSNFIFDKQYDKMQTIVTHLENELKKIHVDQEEYKTTLINNLISNWSNKIRYKLFFFFKKIINRNFDEKLYLEEKAKKYLNMNS